MFCLERADDLTQDREVLGTDGAINHAVVARQGGIEHGSDTLLSVVYYHFLGGFTQGQDRTHGWIHDRCELRDAIHPEI